MQKPNLLVLFGGVSPEHAVSLRSAEAILNNLDPDRYNILPVGITRQGAWYYYGGRDYALLPAETWREHPGCRQALLSPVRGEGLLLREGQGWQRVPVDVVLPVLHGENGEDGSVQGLAQLAGIPCVGSGLAASAACMDKCLTKLVADNAGVRQAAWELVRAGELQSDPDAIVARVQARFAYPVFVKPAGTGSSVGVHKAPDAAALLAALRDAARFDEKILVEEFIDGQEIEVAVLGNRELTVSGCGEIDPGVEFYDYDAKYITDTASLYIPARISREASEQVRTMAARVYAALGCRGLARVDFFVTRAGEAVFNEINTLPGFTSISMYPKLFAAAGLPFGQLLDRLIALAQEEQHG